MASAIDAHDLPEVDRIERGGVPERRIGTIVASTYRLTRHIGSGGSSHVFEAEHVRLGKAFAVKLLRPELDANRRAAQRFRREARAIARLKSEHIVSVIDCGELDDGTPYLVMELLEGEDLRGLLNREGPLPARRAVPLIIEACRGLSEVHAAGLVHRDLKPENLFITKRSTGEDWCKVLDFGVAKMEASLATAEGAIVGTLRYMAPEQLDADGGSVGFETDVYALGAILHECLTGKPLVTGSTVQEVMYRIMNAEPEPLATLVRTLPRNLIQIIQCCIQKSPAARPSSADDLAIRLLSTAANPSATTTADTTAGEDNRVRHTALPRRAVPAQLAALVLFGLVGSALAGWYAGWAAPRPQTMGTIAAASQIPSNVPGPTVGASAAAPDVSANPSLNVAIPATPSLTASPSRAPAGAPRGVASSSSRATMAPHFDSANPYAE